MVNDFYICASHPGSRQSNQDWCSPCTIILPCLCTLLALQAAHNSPAQGHGSPRKQKQAGFISRLCGRSSQYEDAHVPGKKWVQVFDHAGAKWGHVLLSSWLDTSEERTVMHQSSPPMMQTLMAVPQQPYLPPPPSYLPPLQNTRDLGGGVVSQGKGYQQLTSWQVNATSLHSSSKTQLCHNQPNSKPVAAIIT